MFLSISNHACHELATAAQDSSRRLQALLKLSAGVVGCFAQAAQQANMCVLPDAKLALKEKESALSNNLLDLQEDSLVDLRARGNDMQWQHTELKSCVQGLITSTQRYRKDRSSAMAEAILFMREEKQLDSPRSVQTSSTEYESAGHGDQSSDDEYQSSDDSYEPSSALIDCKTEGSMNNNASSDSCDPDSEALLLKSVEELKKIDEIVEAGLGFWRDMNAMLQKLTQTKQHTSCLVRCANGSERIYARIEQRFEEYTSMWASMCLHCQEYLAEHKRSSISMHEVSHKLVDVGEYLVGHKSMLSSAS